MPSCAARGGQRLCGGPGLAARIAARRALKRAEEVKRALDDAAGSTTTRWRPATATARRCGGQGARQALAVAGRGPARCGQLRDAGRAFHAFDPRDLARDGVRVLDESGAPPSNARVAHPGSNQNFRAFLAARLDLVVVPDKNNHRTHRVVGPRWLRDLRMQACCASCWTDGRGGARRSLRCGRRRSTRAGARGVGGVGRHGRDSALRAAALYRGGRAPRALRLRSRAVASTPAAAAAVPAGVRAAGTLLGWDVPALGGVGGSDQRALAWLITAGASSGREPDTAQHALHYLFRALAGELRATLIDPIGEAAGSSPRAGRGARQLVQDPGSLRGHRAGHRRRRGVGVWRVAAQAANRGRRARHPDAAVDAEADEEQSVRATYASCSGSCTRRCCGGAHRRQRGQLQGTAARGAQSGLGDELATGDAAARQQQTYTELEKELEEAEMAGRGDGQAVQAAQDQRHAGDLGGCLGGARGDERRDSRGQAHQPAAERPRAALLPATAAEMLGRARPAAAAAAGGEGEAERARPPIRAARGVGAKEPEPEPEPAPAAPPPAAAARASAASVLEEIIRR